ncbi:MAG: type IV toxin-antitoxin system AbiEi family antitoxin domain-containing protein [Acidimicrobiia bacterium]
MQKPPERRVEALGREQLGIVDRADVLETGLSPRRIGRRLESGRWEVLQRGVYALSGSPPSWERSVLAAVLAAGPGAVASHMTAFMLHGLDGGYRAEIAITVDDTTPRSLRRVVVHRSLVLAPEDRTVVRGIAVTSVARTLADCSGMLSLGQLARGLDDALVRDLVTHVQVDEVAKRLGPARGRKISRLRILLSERGRESDTAGSRPEMRMFRVLRDAGLPDPESQHPVVVGVQRFFIDAAYPEQLLALEYQGFDPHRTRRSFDADARRTRLLASVGWTVLCFTSRDTDADIVSAVRPFVT